MKKGKKMSTNLKAPTDNISATRFWGGNDRGSCIQLTMPVPASLAPRNSITDSMFDMIQLSRSEALLVAKALIAFGTCTEEEDEAG